MKQIQKTVFKFKVTDENNQPTIYNSKKQLLNDIHISIKSKVSLELNKLKINESTTIKGLGFQPGSTYSITITRLQ
jgi:hypothetical protein